MESRYWSSQSYKSKYGTLLYQITTIPEKDIEFQAFQPFLIQQNFFKLFGSLRIHLQVFFSTYLCKRTM